MSYLDRLNEYREERNRVNRPRVVFAVILVALSLTMGYEMGHAATSPTIPRTGTGGNIGPCTWFASLDGTTPVAEAMIQTTISGTTYNPGDNKVGSAGQDPAAFLSTVIASNEEVCLSGQTFTFVTTLQISQPGVTFVGIGPATVITQGNALNLGSLVYVTGQNTFIANMAFDGNRAQQTGPASSGCLRFSAGSDGSKVFNVFPRHCWDNGIYICASSGVAACVSPVAGTPKSISLDTVNSTDNGKGSLSGSGFDNGSGSYVTLTNYQSISDEVGLISTDIGASAATAGFALSVQSSVKQGIYNGCSTLLSNLFVLNSGTYGVTFDGGCDEAMSNFDISGSTTADINFGGTIPASPYRIINGFARSATKIAYGSPNGNLVILQNVAGINPIGKVTTPLFGSTNLLAPWGNVATLTSGVVMTMAGASGYVQMNSGTGCTSQSLQIEAPDGTIISVAGFSSGSGSPTIGAYTSIGFKIVFNFAGCSTNPTSSIFFD